MRDRCQVGLYLFVSFEQRDGCGIWRGCGESLEGGLHVGKTYREGSAPLGLCFSFVSHLNRDGNKFQMLFQPNQSMKAITFCSI